MSAAGMRRQIDLIKQQSKLIADLTAELTAYREQADSPEDIAELARQVARYAGVFKELREAKRMLAEIVAERDEYRTRCLSTYCAFCGEHFPADEDTQGEKTDAVQVHIRTCPKHPMREVEAERDRLRDRVEYLESTIPRYGGTSTR
jgi:hypothetical protein